MRRGLHRKTVVAALAAAVGLLVTGVALPSAASAVPLVGSKSVPLGFDSGACPGSSISYVTRLQGAPVRVGSTSLNWSSWDEMNAYYSRLDCWASRPAGLPVQWAVPLFASGGTMAEAAAGAYDDYWRAFGYALVHGDATKGSAQPNAILRLAWEFNGDWQLWAQGTTAASNAQFIAAWRHAVNALRSVAGQHFQIVWNLTVGTTASDARLAYPGDKYVDVVGLDDYDGSWLPGTYPYPARASAKVVAARQAKALAYKLYQPKFGFNAWALFAAQHHKKVALCEWGLMKTTDNGGHGGGDDAVYVHGIFSWSRAQGAKKQISYISYLNQVGAFDSRLNTASTKAATAAYRAEARVSGH